MGTLEQHAAPADGPAVSPAIEIQAAPTRQTRAAEAVLLATAILALGLWLVSGACRWQGYPVDHPGGPVIAALLAAAAMATLAAIAWLAVSPHIEGHRPVLVALVGWTATRLAMSSLFPMISDEAYHWMWGRYLDLGYYDHPGMVAWMGRLLVPMHGQAAALARLSSIVQAAGIVLLVYALARITGGTGRMAARSALVIMLVPMFSLGGMLLIPSVAVNLFWLATLVFVWRAVRGTRMVDWALAGLACGGALNANYTSFGLPVCVLAYLLISPLGRQALRRPGPYVAALAALAGFVPSLVWNAQHDWITLTWNLYYRHDPMRFEAEWLGIYLGELLVFLSPLLTVLGVWVAAGLAWRGWRNSDEGVLYLAVMAFAPLLAWTVIGSVKFIVAYYTAPAFAPLVILCIRGCSGPAGGWTSIGRGHWYRRAVAMAAATSALIFAALLALTFVPPELAAEGLRRVAPRTAQKLLAEFYGWSALGRYLDGQASRMSTDTPLVVVATSYAQASSAMYYAHNLQMAYSLDEGVGRYGQQFVFWAPRRRIPLGCDVILFEAGPPRRLDQNHEALSRCFDRLEVQQPAGDPRLRYWTILRGYGYKGGLENYPPPRRRTPTAARS